MGGISQTQIGKIVCGKSKLIIYEKVNKGLYLIEADWMAAIESDVVLSREVSKIATC